MEKDRIIEVLAEWNFWKEDRDTGIERAAYLDRMKALAKTGQIVSIIGVRRSGKSTLMKQYMKMLIDSGADRKDLLYINFEDPRFAGELSVKFLQDSYDAFVEIVKPKGKKYIFLDEIQNVPEWERFVRSMHERKEAQIFISGSSSKLLSKELGTVLTGRHVQLVVYPLSFMEFLQFKGIEFSGKLDLLSKKTLVKQMLREYLEFGGFPLAVLSEEKPEILKRYFDDIIARDITERYKVAKTEKLKALAKFYLSSTSSQSSFRSISKFIGLSLDTVERFSNYLAYSYLVFFTRKFSYSLKEQEVNTKKVYCIDLGLRNIAGFKFSEDIGRLYENAVFLKLVFEGEEIYYWKNSGECDFIIKDGRKIIQAIQVSYSLKENKEREIDGLEEAAVKFGLKEGLVITEDYEAEEKRGKVKIKFVPLWKWLLE